MKKNVKKIGMSVLLSSLLCGVMPALAQSPEVNLLVCSDRGYTLTSTANATGTSAVTYEWFENGSAVSGSNVAALSIPAGTKAPGVYSYVRKASSADCAPVSSNTFTVQVLKPDVPTVTATVAALCEGAGDVEFTITPAANTTYTWTTAASGGAPSGDDNSSYTFSSPAAGTFEVQAKATTEFTVGSLAPKTCVSGLSTVAQAVVNPLPVVTPAGVFAQCGGGAFPLSVQVTVNGSAIAEGLVTITWYSDAAGTASVNTGAGYSPSLTATAKYYVGAVVNATSCESADLTEVAATLNLYEGTISGQED